jgi:hypothetical protein
MMIIWWALKGWLGALKNWPKRLYHSMFSRWAVVEVQSDGTIQILSTHTLHDVAQHYCQGSRFNEYVITRESALARIARG